MTRHKALDLATLECGKAVEPESPDSAIEALMIFDARHLDRQTRQELLQLLPQLIQVQQAWRAEFLENGCIHCRRKDVQYGSGGFCLTCKARFHARMSRRYKKLMQGRDIERETAAFANALQLKYNTAQQLFTGEE